MIKNTIILIIATLLGTAVLMPATQVGAVDVFKDEACNGDTSICGSDNTELTDILTVVINTMIYITGIIAVIMIIIGGIKYTTSSGDASGITSAKNTILYSVIGLVIAIMSFAIVNFVLDRFGASSGGSSTEGTTEEAAPSGGGTTPSGTGTPTAPSTRRNQTP